MKRTINSYKVGCQILHLQTINPFCNLNMSEKRLGKNLIKGGRICPNFATSSIFLKFVRPFGCTCLSCNELKTHQSRLVSDQLKL